MDSQAIYDKIRETVQSNLPGARVLLFGSRARGDHDSFSDYDLLVITPQSLTPKEKISWSTLLNRALVTAINAPVDILVNSEADVRESVDLPGHILRSAVREGIAL